MPHKNVTLIWGYRDCKPPEFRQLIENLQNCILPVAKLYDYTPCVLDDVHITILGCEACAHSGNFYSRPMLEHLFGSSDLSRVPLSELRDKQIDFDQLAKILHVAFDTPIRVKFGGYSESSWPPLLYAGWSLYRMSFYFGFLAPNFVVTGWPMPFWGWQLIGLRALAEKANVLHKYHCKGEWPPDGDAYAVIGRIANIQVHPHPRHYSEVEQFPPEIAKLLNKTRDWLSKNSIEVEFTKDNVEFVAYDDTKLSGFRKRKPLSHINNGSDILDLYI